MARKMAHGLLRWIARSSQVIDYQHSSIRIRTRTYWLQISCKVGAQRQRQQVLPLAELALRAHALRDPEARDDRSICLQDFRQYSAKGYLARFGKALTLVGAVHCPYVIETSSGQFSRLD